MENVGRISRNKEKFYAVQDNLQRLQESEHRLTRQREAVLKAFLELSPEHPTAERIYQVAKNYCSSLGLATVYRTLDLFAQLGIAQKIPSTEGIARYDIDKASHAHFVCFGCGESGELDLKIDTLVKECKEKGFEVVKSSLLFFGYCPSCRDKAR